MRGTVPLCATEMHRVLLVEDDPEIRMLLRIALTNDGFNVVEAQNGAAALDVLDSATPDVVVTDLLMPLIDGIELVRFLRASKAHANLPVLVITALNQDHRGVVEVQRQPGVVVTAKPFRPREVCQLVRELAEAA